MAQGHISLSTATGNADCRKEKKRKAMIGTEDVMEEVHVLRRRLVSFAYLL
jgi:hypothetical protein